MNGIHSLWDNRYGSKNKPIEIDRKSFEEHDIIIYDSLKHSTIGAERRLFIERKVIPTCFDVLGVLWEEYERLHYSVLSKPSDRRNFIKSIYSISEYDDVFAGGAWINNKGLIHIFVLDEYRRKGIGQNLLNSMERYGDDKVMCQWDLNSRERHKANVEFFKKNGYDISLYGRSARATKILK